MQSIWEWSGTFASVCANAVAIFMLWLFAGAGVHKLLPANSDGYAEIFNDFGITAPGLARSLPKLIGALEITLGLMIVLPFTRTSGALAGAGLLLAYMGLLGWQLAKGRADMNCGCSGPAGELKISTHLLWRNFTLAALALLCLAPLNPTPTSATVDHWNAWLLAGTMAAAMILLYLSCEQLIGNAQKLKTLKY